MYTMNTFASNLLMDSVTYLFFPLGQFIASLHITTAIITTNNATTNNNMMFNNLYFEIGCMSDIYSNTIE